MGLKPAIHKHAKAKHFNWFVKRILTAEEYELLPEKLGLSGTWFTRSMDNPALFKERHLLVLAEVLRQQPYVLMQLWNVGGVAMTATQAISYKLHYDDYLANRPSMSETDEELLCIMAETLKAADKIESRRK